MLDYTKAAFEKIIGDVKKAAFYFEFFTQIFMLAYLVYALFVNPALRIVNGILLSLTAFYLFFFLRLSQDGFSKKEKQLKKRVAKIFQYIKRTFKLYTLGVAIYGIYTNISSLDFVSLLLTVFTAVTFVTDIVLEVTGYILNFYKDLILTGVETDVSNALKPVKTVGNFTKKIFGKEVEAEPEPTKERLLLDKIVEEKKQQAQRLKEQKKQEKAQKKQEDKLYKLQVKQEKRMAKQAKKQAAKETAAEEVALTETLALPENALPAAPETEKPRKKRWWKRDKQDGDQTKQNEQDGENA